MMGELWTNLSQFHFIRPQWLWGLAVTLVLWLLLGALKKHTRWEAYFERSKLEALKVSGGKFSSHSRWLLLAGWILVTLAAAGPTWQQVPTPTVRDQSAMVILLDLSPSMMAEDMTPDRLTRAKYKLIDILRQRVDGQTALIAYAGDPHTVSPLTDDASTIEALLPALHPSIMPESGSNTEAAVELGMTLLHDAGLNRGQLLLITDGVAPDAQSYIRDNLGANFQLSILGVGTTDAVPIPQEGGGFIRDSRGGLVTTRLNRDELQLLAAVLRGHYVEIQSDDSDIEYLLQDSRPAAEASDASASEDRLYDLWEDMGYWLILLVLPFLAWHFRKGALFVLPLILFMPDQSHAFSWKDLWQTPDQQGQRLLDEDNAEAAAEIFENPNWKASAHYQAGNYAQAAEGFANSEDAQSLYNLGNALAMQQDFEGAIEAYNQILEQDPDHEDAAYNKSVVEKLMQQQDQQQSGDQGQNQQDQENQEGQQSQDQQDQSQQGESGEQDSEQQGSEQQQNSQQEAGESDQQGEQEDQAESQPDNSSDQPNSENEEQAQEEARQALSQASEEQPETGEESGAVQALPGEATPDQMQDSSEQWLRGIPDDPSGLLRRKFEYETQRNRLEQRYLFEAPGNSNEERY